MSINKELIESTVKSLVENFSEWKMHTHIRDDGYLLKRGYISLEKHPWIPGFDVILFCGGARIPIRFTESLKLRDAMHRHLVKVAESYLHSKADSAPEMRPGTMRQYGDL